ncbi:hypothetical protein I3843_02G048400 [Carya illinoinensis]|nr:hypothetical protein I3760_02G060600 [Carya illinoinensis]KAG7990907.1 hypothetical protein I3843_02G048400 [Carya illinoinensis]
MRICEIMQSLEWHSRFGSFVNRNLEWEHLIWLAQDVCFVVVLIVGV